MTEFTTRTGKEIVLSDEQEDAFDRVCDYIRWRPQRTFTMHGYAGTGKTTLCTVVHYRAQAFVCTFAAAAGREVDGLLGGAPPHDRADPAAVELLVQIV